MNVLHRASGVSAGFIIALSLAGCAEIDPLEPPRLHFGQDVCAVCHMIITDDRYAAAISVEGADGRIEKHSFDDIGCIFEYESQHPSQKVLAYFVHDEQARRWIDATEASYVHSRNIHTPMAFGLSAHTSLSEARDRRRETNGDLITFNEARRRFHLNVLHTSTLDDQQQTISRETQREHEITLDDGRQLRVQLRSPQQLPPGVHPFEISIVNLTEHEAYITDAEIEIEPWMPSMHHGSLKNVNPTYVGDGLYRGQAHFTMSGYWIVHVTIRAGSAEPSRSTFHFEATR